MRNTLYIIIAAILLGTTQIFAQKQSTKVDEEMRKLLYSAVLINNTYVDTVDSHKLVEDAIRGMLDKLDPHSAYTSAKETKKFTEPLNGSFDGIGVQFNILEDTVVVIQPVVKGPSEKVGILAGDRIISVGDTILAGVKKSREDIMSLLRGPRGSIAHLGIVRLGVKDILYFDVKRDKIPLHTLDAAFMVTPTIGLVRFSSFGATTHDEVVEAISKLKAQGMKSLIIDLTQNGGGYLNAAADIASEFLPKNDLVVYTKGRAVPNQEFRSTGASTFQKGKVAVLIDEYSASAAEILSGAIQDQDRGTIIGRRSFGKGLVQRPIDLPDGSMIRLTVAHYYTPSGRCIQKPYEKGKQKDYQMDVLNRFNHGELTNRDSIHLVDSLRYYTLRKHRVVYGGGGIMPDCFVPLDTTLNTKMYRKISANNLIINNSLRYLDKNREQIKQQYPTFEEFKKNYQTPESELQDVLDQATKKDIKPQDDEELQKTKSRLSLILKALTARDIWDLSEYFSVIYDDDALIKKAVEVLEKK